VLNPRTGGHFVEESARESRTIESKQGEYRKLIGGREFEDPLKRTSSKKDSSEGEHFRFPKSEVKQFKACGFLYERFREPHASFYLSLTEEFLQGNGKDKNQSTRRWRQFSKQQNVSSIQAILSIIPGGVQTKQDERLERCRDGLFPKSFFRANNGQSFVPLLVNSS
jgi:hypothetical protein